MCRHLAYWGPARPLAELIVDTPHSLVDQCTAARHQSSGCENPDGWGFGFYDSESPSPRRYRTSVDMPADVAGMSQLADTCSGRFMAHIRHKSPGAPVEVEGNAPFVDGRWMFAHNGFAADWFEGVGAATLQGLSPARRARLHGHADSEALFGLVMDRIDAGNEPAAAMVEVIEPLSGPDRDRGRFNFLLTDGNQLLATRWGNSLYLRVDEANGARAVIVASEPFDDAAGWDVVPDHTLLRIDADGVELLAH